jgi:hypothetical protein
MKRKLIMAKKKTNRKFSFLTIHPAIYIIVILTIVVDTPSRRKNIRKEREYEICLLQRIITDKQYVCYRV